jgi:outer membrane protein OmpA-like peptidoglycan-associated protein
MRTALVLALLCWPAAARAQLPDADADGVADPDDACPAEAEDADGYDDGDGCPEHGAKIAGNRLELYDPLAFVTGKAELVPHAQPSLAAAVKIMRQHRSLRLHIEVHTDSQGSDAFNLTMSQKRADAVRDAFIAEGLPPTWVTATGYGETRPIDGNASAAGRARNRRVELVIVRKK